MDDPQRLEGKESYIKGFEPWGWVIGTGTYTGALAEFLAAIMNPNVGGGDHHAANHVEHQVIAFPDQAMSVEDLKRFAENAR